MKKILTNSISENVRYPITTLFALHLQEAYTEIVDALVKGLIEDASILTILNGCAIGGVNPAYTVSAGAIYYQGEVFLVDAATVNVPSGQVLVWKIEETYRTGDPVIFSDNIPRNAHLIRKMKLVAGAAGSGVADNSEVKRLLESGSLNTILSRISTAETGLSDAEQDILGVYQDLIGLDNNKAEKTMVANKVQPSWIDLGLSNGWLHSRKKCQYRKNEFGKVEFRGAITGFGSTVTSGLFATLPIGYRPHGGQTGENINIIVVNTSTSDPAKIQITGSGQMYINGYAQNETYDLTSLSFYPEALESL